MARQIVVSIHEFAFMGGSLGIAAGEAIIRAFEKAIELKAPPVMYPLREARACRKAFYH